ncbi:hypothetical protein Kpol_2002p28 [Vanderwaltozyma polyspora DSM 70294]|uniref:ER membrane protein complex subunit 1 n=1 Tax=Vanderwaltozyma polyspora (strain ATCC 22028 / DSM 70294 / BCRC 21397 / CBS 2163 / NBRC 10782 / NRRL Y-8283 / UCD 57-17) TaxID=436907 RepID=A7TFE4_VANPO|nr:uncharacterized protein Kpol_2002p28 [Vanderwaltozyma polyspora DSM 70294]EDO18958.1 hypothetical protein Kpol_2002p28 [Vanderwaltozyma polyspora DSM 70294]
MLSFIFFLYALCIRCTLVKAVFFDEAFVNDWQLQNIGDYSCVVSDFDDDQLIVFSDFEGKTMLSIVNETDGSPMTRLQLDVKIVDVMRNENDKTIIMEDSNGEYMTFNAILGFGPIADGFVKTSFRSSCVPNLESIKVTKDQLQVIDKDSHLSLFSSKLPKDYTSVKFLETDHAGILKVIYEMKPSQYQFQSFVDGELSCTWEKDESLNDITSYAFVDIPDTSDIEASMELLEESKFDNPLDAYIYRITTNIDRFRKFLAVHNYSPGDILTGILFNDRIGNVEEKLSKKEIQFGLSKLLVVGTSNGKLAGLSVKNGEVKWSLDTKFGEIIQIRWSESSNSLLVVYKNGSYSIYSIIDYLQPILEKTHKLQKSIKDIHYLDGTDSYYITYDNDEKSIVKFEESEEANTSSLFIMDHDEKHLLGYSVGEKSDFTPTWKLRTEENEEIVAFASKDISPIANIGTILGNRTVLYKYLYPNLASYAVVNKDLKELYINVIDTISGELLYTQVHSDNVDVSFPINMVFSENWIVFSYFSVDPIPEQKLAVIELYESITPDVRVSGGDTEFSSLNGSPLPEAITKSYFFPEMIKKMSVSNTKYGISSKALIVELENGQISYIPKLIISARRKEEEDMTDDEKNEFMLIPYSNIIPVSDEYVISHKRKLIFGKNSEIVSIPTNLESTTIVCDIGHDVFCTKISPSTQFDVMSPSFEKGKLLFTIFVMGALLLVLRPKVNMKKLKAVWMVRD